jgi:hypothetical protein
MAQTKFKLHTDEEDTITHAHAQQKKVNTPIDIQASKTSAASLAFSISSGVELSVHLIKLFEILSAVQKKQLIEYAKKDDKTASCIIKDLLVESGIIEQDD